MIRWPLCTACRGKHYRKHYLHKDKFDREWWIESISNKPGYKFRVTQYDNKRGIIHYSTSLKKAKRVAACMTLIEDLPHGITYEGGDNETIE